MECRIVALKIQSAGSETAFSTAFGGRQNPLRKLTHWKIFFQKTIAKTDLQYSTIVICRDFYVTAHTEMLKGLVMVLPE
jgi:hypothetical protein